MSLFPIFSLLLPLGLGAAPAAAEPVDSGLGEDDALDSGLEEDLDSGLEEGGDPADAPAAVATPMAQVTLTTTYPGHVVALTVANRTELPSTVTATEGSEREFFSLAGSLTRLAYAQELCIAPCSFSLPAGTHSLQVYGNGRRPGEATVELPEGDIQLLARPGSNALRGTGYGLQILGALTASVGGTYLKMRNQTLPGGVVAFSEEEKQQMARVGYTLLGSGLSVTLGGAFLARSQRLRIEELRPEDGPTPPPAPAKE